MADLITESTTVNERPQTATPSDHPVGRRSSRANEPISRNSNGIDVIPTNNDIKSNDITGSSAAGSENVPVKIVKTASAIRVAPALQPSVLSARSSRPVSSRIPKNVPSVPGIVQHTKGLASSKNDDDSVVDTSRLVRPVSPLMTGSRDKRANIPDAVEARLRLETSKKALRELRSVERRMSWDLQREEKKFIRDVKKTRESDLMQYYKKDSNEMKEYVAQKAKERKVIELAEQKEFQEFKRFARDSHKEHMKKVWAEALDYSTAFSAWQEELKLEYIRREKESASVKKENFDVERVVKQWTKNVELILLSEEREWARQLEAEYALRKATEEQKKLDDKLKILQAAKSRPLSANFI
eukprot:GDKJ01004893.1.p1 GENE.GDKJ01004893.1~~GDKJ01004893.1.p1  ORF type:complete len:356 (+),score=97.37 GDKJ01004893.1:99-1166(+)